MKRVCALFLICMTLICCASCGNSSTIDVEKHQKRTVAVCLDCEDGISVADAARAAKEAGFANVELNMGKEMTLQTSFETLSNIFDAVKATGVDVTGMKVPVDVMSEEGLNELRRYVRLAYAFGCSYVCTTLGNVRHDAKTVAAAKEISTYITPLVPYLNEYGINLVLQLSEDYCTAEKMHELHKEVNSGRVMISYDPAVAMNSGKLDAAKTVEELTSYSTFIANIRLTDTAGTSTEKLLPGKGIVPFADILKALNNKDNHSPVTVEYRFGNKEGDTAALSEVAKYLDGIGFDLDA